MLFNHINIYSNNLLNIISYLDFYWLHFSIKSQFQFLFLSQVILQGFPTCLQVVLQLRENVENNVKFVSQFVKLANIQNANMYMYINVHQNILVFIFHTSSDSRSVHCWVYQGNSSPLSFVVQESWMNGTYWSLLMTCFF